MADDNTLEAEIIVDERRGVSAVERFNAAMKKAEGVVVDVTRHAGSALDSVSRGLVRVTEGVASVVVAASGLKMMVTHLREGTLGMVQHNSATERLLDTYRALRLAIAPTLFTATTLGIGIAIEETVRLTKARAALMRQEAMLAATGKQSYSRVATYGQAERLMGLSRGSLQGAFGKQSVFGISELVDEFRELKDPVERAQYAVEHFGENAAAAMPLLNERMKDNIARAYEMSQAFDGPTRQALLLLDESLGGPKRKLQEIADWFRDLIELSKQKVVLSVAAVTNFMKPVLPGQPVRQPSQYQMLGLEAPPEQDAVPSDLEFASGAWDAAAAARKRLQGLTLRGMSPARGFAFAPAARAIIARNQASPEGVSGALASARSRLQNLMSLFPYGEGLGGAQIVEAQREVDRLQVIDDRNRAAEEARKRSEQEAREFAQGKSRLDDLMLSDTLTRFRGEGFWNPTKRLEYAEGLKMEQQFSDIEQGMRAYALGRLPGEFGPEADARRNDQQKRELTEYFKPRDEADVRHLGSLEHEQRLNEQLIALRTGPGGERQAIEETYGLRLRYAEQEFALHRDQAKYDEQVDEARIDRIRDVAELQRKHFDDLKQSAAGLIDAGLSGSGGSLMSGLKNLLLTPAKEGLSTLVARGLMPLMYGRDGNGGLMGSIAGLFGGGKGLQDVQLVNGAVPVVITNPAMGAAATVAGAAAGALPSIATYFGGGANVFSAVGLNRVAYNPSLYPTANVFGGGSVTQMPVAGSWGSRLSGAVPGLAVMGGGMLAAQGLQRGNGLLTVGGGAAMGYGLAGTLGMTGYGGAIAGAGAGLFADAMRRGGGWGILEGAAGGAIVGMQYGGPLGALIGGIVGGVAGLVRSFWKSAADKAKEKIRSIYGVTIGDKGVLNQIVQMAKQGFGGNLDMAIRSEQIRDLIELYAMTTGQRGMVPANAMRPGSMYQAGGSLFNAPTYSNGSPLPSISSPAPASYNLQLDPEATREFLEGRMVRTIQSNPRAVAASNLQATKQNYARRENMALAFSPSSLGN